MDITVKQMMQIEENGHQMGFPRKLMMENAGASVARYAVEKFPNISSKKFWYLQVLVIMAETHLLWQDILQDMALMLK